MKCSSLLDTDTDFSESEALSSLQISGPAKLGESGKWIDFVFNDAVF